VRRTRVGLFPSFLKRYRKGGFFGGEGGKEG